MVEYRHRRYRFDGRAVKATHAIALDGAWLRAKCKEIRRGFGYEVMHRIATILAHSLDETRLRLLDVYWLWCLTTNQPDNWVICGLIVLPEPVAALALERWFMANT